MFADHTAFVTYNYQDVPVYEICKSIFIENQYEKNLFWDHTTSRKGQINKFKYFNSTVARKDDELDAQT